MRRRRRLLRDDTVAPWLTLAVILGLWWLAAGLVNRGQAGASDAWSRPGAPAADTVGESPARGATRGPSAVVPSRTGAGLVIPVAGVQPDDLRPTFDEQRGGGSRRHEAMDILAPRGTPVLAAIDGPVVKLYTSAAGGLTIYQFDQASEYCYYYAHLDGYAPDLAEGQMLRRGEVIGFVGTTGNAPPSTPHLHFAIFRLGADKRWWEGHAVDPYPLLR